MNTVNLIGRLTKDPDIRYTQGQKTMAIARFSLAVNRKYKVSGQPDADFINCTAFGKTAELIEKYIYKGNQLAVVGHIQTSNYTNKEGQKVYQTDVIVDSIDFIGSKSDSQASDSYITAEPEPTHAEPTPTITVPDGKGSKKEEREEWMNIPDALLGETLPFC